MKYLITLFLFIPLRLFAPADGRITIVKDEAINPFKALWEATCLVESKNNPLAINEAEQAYGIAQIRPIRIKDYNERTGSHYSLYDCLDSSFAYRVYMYYASRYGPTDLEQIAKDWNGSGEMTEIYWNKIKAIWEKK